MRRDRIASPRLFESTIDPLGENERCTMGNTLYQVQSRLVSIANHDWGHPIGVKNTPALQVDTASRPVDIFDNQTNRLDAW